MKNGLRMTNGTQRRPRVQWAAMSVWGGFVAVNAFLAETAFFVWVLALFCLVQLVAAVIHPGKREYFDAGGATLWLVTTWSAVWAAGGWFGVASPLLGVLMTCATVCCGWVTVVFMFGDANRDFYGLPHMKSRKKKAPKS